MANRTVSVNLVANVGQYVGGMNTAAGATMRLGESATASSKKAQSGFDLAGKGALVMGAAVVGGMAMAISKSMEFEKSMSAVAAATKATAGTLADLREAAMKAGADTQYSATEAADAITEMAKAGVSAKDIMGGGLRGALSLAAAGQLEVADAAGIASVAMTQFKLSGEDLPHVADLLAAGAGKAMGSVDDLGQALNQAGLVAASTGVSIEETTGTLAAFASAGLLGSDAGTSLKTMLQRLQNPSDEAAGAMADLGVNMYDANGAFVGMSALAGQLKTGMDGLTQAERDKAMATIFGSDAVRAANVLYKEGAAGIANWTAKVNDQGYAAEQAAKLNDNLAGDLEKLGGAFDTLLISLGEGAQGPLREVVQAFTGILDIAADLIGFWQSLPGPVQAGVAAFAGIAALHKPLDIMFGRLAVGITSAVTGLGMATGATSAWTLALGAARVGVVSLISAAAPLAALVATAYAVKQVVEFGSVTDDARESVEALGDSVQALPVGGQIRTYREEIGRLQEQINSVEGQNLFDKYVWHNPFGNEAKDVAVAREKIEQLNGAIKGLKDDAPSMLEAVAGAVRSTVDTTVIQSEEAAKAIEDWIKSLMQVGSSFVEPLNIYKGLLQEAAQKTADATKSSEDSWQDYADKSSISLDQFARKLEDQIVAQENWRSNLVLISQRGGTEVAQILATMGVEGAGYVQQMVDANGEDFAKMRDLMIRDAQLGGSGAATALDQQMKIMAAIGVDGAGKTVQGIAQQLGIGADTVRDIAAQYGVNLAEGVNPLLGALGKPQVKFGGRGMPEFASGGYTGPGGKYEPAGVVHAGEYVLTKEQTAQLGIDRIEEFANRGYASGGFVTAASVPRPRSTAPYGVPISTAGGATMQKGYDETVAWLQANALPPPGSGGGPLGGGVLGGSWHSIFNAVKAAIPQARANSTFRPGDPGYHGRNKAVDFGFGSGPGGAGSAGLASINRFLHDRFGGSLAELIYDGIGDDRADLKNGRPLTYSAGTRAEHRNHVHAAVYDQGGPLYPGYTLAYNGTGKTEWVSKEFSGGSRGAGGGSATSVSVNIEGARITGTLDLGDGITAKIDGRLEDLYRQKVRT